MRLPVVQQGETEAGSERRDLDPFKRVATPGRRRPSVGVIVGATIRRKARGSPCRKRSRILRASVPLCVTIYFAGFSSIVPASLFGASRPQPAIETVPFEPAVFAGALKFIAICPSQLRWTM